MEETIANWINDAFTPEVVDLITVYPNEIPFRIDIQKGVEKPYYYKDGDGFNAKEYMFVLAALKEGQMMSKSEE